MKSIKVGVVGVGHIGKNHARLYKEIVGKNFVAVFDNDTRRAQAIAAEYGVRAAASLEEFISLVDAASVATPTPFHHPLGMRLLDAGKHLLIEKPIAETTAHARELSELASTRSAVLQVGHIERFNPVMSALEKRLTQPRFIESHRLSPYPERSTEIGVVLDLMIHDLEIILHLVRSPVASIDAVGIPVLSKREDIANARLRFASGCVANITVSRISPEKMRKIRVFQEDAYLSLDYQAQSGEMYRKGLLGIKKEDVPIEKSEPLKRELQSFLECAAEGRQPKVSGQDAALALELALEITAIIDQNRQP